MGSTTLEPDIPILYSDIAKEVLHKFSLCLKFVSEDAKMTTISILHYSLTKSQLNGQVFVNLNDCRARRVFVVQPVIDFGDNQVLHVANVSAFVAHRQISISWKCCHLIGFFLSKYVYFSVGLHKFEIFFRLDAFSFYLP